MVVHWLTIKFKKLNDPVLVHVSDMVDNLCITCLTYYITPVQYAEYTT